MKTKVIPLILLIACISLMFSNISFAQEAYNQPLLLNLKNENKILIRLGYTEKALLDILSNKTVFSKNNSHIDTIVKSLPLPSKYKYKFFSLENDTQKIINIGYQYDERLTSKGKAKGEEHFKENKWSEAYSSTLDPFSDTIGENNALLLFSSIDGLEKVNFQYFDYNQKLNNSIAYTIEDLTKRFGSIKPFDLKLEDLYTKLEANIQLDEFYFGHSDRFYLGSTFKAIEYRIGKADEVKTQKNGSTVWIYHELGKIYEIRSSGELIVHPRVLAKFYFDNPLAIKNYMQKSILC